MKEKYARLLLIKCLGLENKRPLFIQGNEYTREFIEIVKKEANKLGIDDIYVLSIDQTERHDLIKKLSLEEIITHPLFDKSIMNTYAEKGAAFLMLSSMIPNLMNDVDKDKLAKTIRHERETEWLYRKKQHVNEVPWCIACIPNIKWAKDLFPSEEGALDKLWNLIYQICLVDKKDPIKAWDELISTNKTLCDKFNKLELRELRYKNSLGTDLSIKLPEGHIWCGGTINNDLIVNMPTLEIFTSPLMKGVNGIVYNAKPLLYNNVLIDDFYIEFKDGKVINYAAKKGFDTLKGIIETDEYSCYLGEVALVPYDSAISNTNVIFKDTLLDENASCHLALGASYPECMKDADNKEKDELRKMGVNDSKAHVDFMVGTSDLDIVGITKDNKKIQIFKNGNFSEDL